MFTLMVCTGVVPIAWRAPWTSAKGVLPNGAERFRMEIRKGFASKLNCKCPGIKTRKSADACASFRLELTMANERV